MLDTRRTSLLDPILSIRGIYRLHGILGPLYPRTLRAESLPNCLAYRVLASVSTFPPFPELQSREVMRRV